jgi:hypothetical protein
MHGKPQDLLPGDLQILIDGFAVVEKSVQYAVFVVPVHL